MSKRTLSRRWVLVVLVISLIAVLWIPFQQGAAQSLSATPTPGPTGETAQVDQAITQAIEQAAARRQTVAAFQLFEIRVASIQVGRDGDVALAWLALADPQTGQVISGEPGLAVLHLADPSLQNQASAWTVQLSGDDGFIAALQALPADLQNGYIQDNFLGAPAPAQPEAIGGYHLPWAAGVAHQLGGSIGHFLIYNSCSEYYCRYAFDFDDISNPKYPLLAARGGTVLGARWTCDDRPQDATVPGTCTNYIALRDPSTTPATVQIYLHLSRDTIPAALRTVGTPVQQGQFIGNVDNTGYSFGSHVHFMVVADDPNTLYYSSTGGYWWGPSIDITFDEVTVNGGRPRTCYEALHWPQYGSECMPPYDLYVSANVGSNPPTGTLILPPDKTLLQGNTVLAGGWGSDDLGVTRMSLIANYDGTWREVGPAQTTTPFAFDLDLCSTGIPDGPFDLALRVWDKEGNQSLPQGLRHLVKDSHCPAPPPPPTCTPTVDQVAIFTGVNFTGGCAILGKQNSPNAAFFDPLGDNQVSSIRLGANVRAVLYDGPNFTLRSETLTSSVRNLANNRIGAGTLSSMKVLDRVTPPASPVLSPVLTPTGQAPNSVDSLVLTWNGPESTKFQGELYSGADTSGTRLLTRGFSTDSYWPIGSLAAGTYTWRIQGRVADQNNNTYFSGWATQTFNVSAGSLSNPSPLALPWSDAMEAGTNGWTATGLWHLAADPLNLANHAWVFNNNNGTAFSGNAGANGDLTTAPLAVPPGSAFYLRFSYLYHTETSGPSWDQRWVQVSRDGGPFQNLAQLTGELMDTWLTSPFISLAGFAGSTIRLRFHFDTLDNQLNDAYLTGTAGWFVDNVTFSATAPPSGCGETTPNDTPASAVKLLSQAQTVSGMICPPGDVDYYAIDAVKGETLVVDVNAQTLNPSSPLNSMVSIFMDPDNNSLLAENYDELPGVLADPYISYPVTETGTYYIRVKAQNHPGVGGPEDRYDLIVRREQPSGGTDTTDPQLTLTRPSPTDFLSSNPLTLTASAIDEAGGSGMDRVEFWWHSNDWTSGQWQLVGTDWNGANGWQVLMAIPGLLEEPGYAMMALAYDQSGNAAVTVNWNVNIDITPPSAAFQTPPPVSASTAFLLSWSGSDALSGLDHFEIQVNRDGAGWQDWQTSLPANTLQAWFTGEFGHQYAFRLRAVDRAGNFSVYASAALSVEATCQKDAFDAGSGDNTRLTVRDIPLKQFETHNFCGVGDEDWVHFNAAAGDHLLLFALPDPGSPAWPALELYSGSSQTPLLHASAATLGSALSVAWVAPQSGEYFLNLHAQDPAIAGSGASYRLWVGQGLTIYLPVIGK